MLLHVHAVTIILQFLFTYMQWLQETFIPYLDGWEKSVQEREGFSNQAKIRMLLSQETSLGIRISGECVTFFFVIHYG